MKPLPVAAGIAFLGGFALLLVHFARAGGTPLLSPSGSIGIAEKSLMLHATLLMLIVAVPVYALIAFIAWRYRAGNTGAKYTPNWENSTMEEFIWWSIPLEIVLVLGALTWSSTHALAPENALASAEPPEVVQVVALPWKWLFIYPREGIASVNELALPEDRSISFEITADAPMNSLWIPSLGGQMYAMAGMATRLNLMTGAPGTYEGRSANYSGEGFADMRFPAKVMTEQDWEAWKAHAEASGGALTPDAFEALAQPSSHAPTAYFSSVSIPFATIVDMSMGLSATSSKLQNEGRMGSMSM